MTIATFGARTSSRSVNLRPPSRLEAALTAAFRLQTQELADLLEEASLRALEVLISALAGRPRT